MKEIATVDSIGNSLCVLHLFKKCMLNLSCTSTSTLHGNHYEAPINCRMDPNRRPRRQFPSLHWRLWFGMRAPTLKNSTKIFYAWVCTVKKRHRCSAKPAKIWGNTFDQKWNNFRQQSSFVLSALKTCISSVCSVDCKAEAAWQESIWLKLSASTMLLCLRQLVPA